MRLSRITIRLAAILVCGSAVSAEEKTAPPDEVEWTAQRICKEIDLVSRDFDLPRATFTRLIWIESRFDIKARSPKGAQGIAQFMPATAQAVGLDDPYDPVKALNASGALLATLRQALGNFGLAAMAYNAGPRRVERWMAGRGNLPFETQDYIAAVTGQPAEAFRKRDAAVHDFSLSKGKSFEEACTQLPVLKTRFGGAVASPDGGAIDRQPWGVQVAGHFSQAQALRSWTRVRGKLGLAIGNAKPALYRQRALRGMKPKWAVRIGAPDRTEAIAICRKIQAAGGFCLVKRN